MHRLHDKELLASSCQVDLRQLDRIRYDKQVQHLHIRRMLQSGKEILAPKGKHRVNFPEDGNNHGQK